MTDLNHSIPIDATPEAVFAAIATSQGNCGWWTADSAVEGKVGGTAEFGFDERAMVFRMTVDQFEPGRALAMTCSGDQPEWAGTSLIWRIEPGDEGVVLHFTHKNWREMTDFCASCNSMWGNLMFRLKAFAETSVPAPQWTK